MKMTERFTRLNNDFLIYTITVEDPVVLTHSWTARFPLKLDNGFQMLEYACTEDNHMIPQLDQRFRPSVRSARGTKGTTLMIAGSRSPLRWRSLPPVTTLAAITDPVKTSDGQMSGVTLSSGVRAFKGIPFAAPPVGSLRWKEPQPAARWKGVRKADTFGNVCVQPSQPKRVPNNVAVDLPDSPKMSEDCLYLNVWTDAKRANAHLPVMFWIYGGAYTEGAGSSPHNDGEALAHKGVVLVTFNYRLGPFGFFSHPELTKESGRNASGNQALDGHHRRAEMGAEQYRVRSAAIRTTSRFSANPPAPPWSAGWLDLPSPRACSIARIAESGQWMGLGMGPMVPLARAEQGPPRFGPPQAQQSDDAPAATSAAGRTARPIHRGSREDHARVGHDHRRLDRSRRCVDHFRARQAESGGRDRRLQQGRASGDGRERGVSRHADVGRAAVRRAPDRHRETRLLVFLHARAAGRARRHEI